MKITLEYILAEGTARVIRDFCENLAELGYRPEIFDKKNRHNSNGLQFVVSPDMWFRYLSPKEQIKVARKLMKIVKRDAKRFKKTKRGKK